VKNIGFLLIFFVLVGCAKDDEKNVPHDVASQPMATSQDRVFSLNAEEKEFLHFVYSKEVEDYIAGKDSTIKELEDKGAGIGIYPVESSKYQKDYEDNEVRADQSYLNKIFAVNGKVLSIDKSLGNVYSIKLEGSRSMFSAPRAIMIDKYVPWMANLSKGQEVSLVCTGGGLWATSAIVKACMPGSEYAKDSADRYVEKLLKNDHREVFLALLVYYFSGLGKSCASDLDKCLAAFKKNAEFMSEHQAKKLSWAEKMDMAKSHVAEDKSKRVVEIFELYVPPEKRN